MNRTNIIGLFITLCLFSVGLPRSFAQTDRASEAQQLAKGLETTGSDVPLAPPNPPIAKNDKLPTQRTATSTSLINLDDFRADPRFAGIDGNGVTTVVLDTGIDLDHPYFGPDGDGDGVADRIVYHYDFAHNDNDASDFHGHGSNVTSIVAGGSTAYSGMAPQANIIHLKVFTDSGAGNFGMTESALQWIVANAATYNIVSVNMSLGDSQNHAAPTTLYGLTDELAALTALDVIVVSSSGNSFYNWGSAQGSGYPGADPFSLSVGAVYDSNAGSFNYGGVIAYGSVADALTPFSQRHHSMSDIFAPGAPISGAGPTGGVVTMHGTSQSAPHIAGIVALMQQLAHQELGRFLNLGEIRSLLITTGVTIYDGDDENDNVTNTNISYKRVDVLALGEAILAMATPPVSGDFHVTNHTPADNGRIVPVNSYAVGTFNQSLLSGSTSDTQFTLHGFQTGSYFGSISANANQLTFGPGANFKPGEPLVATLTRYTKSDAMDLLGDNHVTWQFRADVAGGTGSFIDSSQQLGNAHTQDVALGDLDNDGDLDAFVTDHPNIGSIWINQGGAQSGSIGIYVNSGQSLLGTRSAHAPSSERAPTSTSGTQISLGDIDSDGDLDAIVVGNYEVITLWVNQGGAQSGTAGIFADSGQTITAGGSSGTGALGDLDGDGDLDLVVASRGGWGDGKGNEVLFNQGGVQSGTEGVFIDSGQQLGSSDSSDVALGDLDGDGDLDAFFTNDFGQPNEVNINDGNGVFSGSLNSFTGERSTNVELGDLDGDGDLDAFITNGNGPGKPNTVWINQGRSQNGTEGIFLDSGQTLGTENSWDARLGDVDADGDLDAYVSNTISGAFGDDRLWINDGNGNFADSGNQLGHTRGAVNIDMGDVDGDGDLDTFIGVAVGPNEVWLNENAANTACITPPLGMTAWWDLDDTGSIARERVHGNDGVYYSPTSTLGKVSNARSFDGIDDHIIIADADELDVGSGSFSLDFWIKLSPGASDGSVLDKRGTSPNPYGYDVVTIGGYLGLRLDTLTSSMTTSTQQRVDDGEWHLVVYTADRTAAKPTVRAYVDGVLTGSYTSAHPILGSLDNSAPLLIGRSHDGTYNDFTGELDEIELFDRLLTPAEIQGLYDAGSAGKCKTAPGSDPTLLSLYALAFDNDPLSPGALTGAYQQTVQEIVNATTADANKTAVILADLEMNGDTHILVVQNGLVTPIDGLPDTSTHLLDPTLEEYDMSDGANLGAFLSWARGAYDADKTTFSYIGHGTALTPDTDIANLLSSTRTSTGLIPLPTWVYAGADLTDHTSEGLINPYDLSQALSIGTNNGADPIELLDLTHCFAATVEEFYELSNDGGTPFAEVMTGSPNYAYFAPQMAGKVLAAMSPSDNAATLASTLLATYESILTSADLEDGNSDVDHPRSMVAVASSELPALKAEIDQLAYYLIQQFDSNSVSASTKLQTAYNNTSTFYDQTFCEADWDLTPPDGLVDAKALMPQLVSQFGTISGVGLRALQVQTLIDQVMLEHVTASGTPWFGGGSHWALDAADASGLAIFADFEGRTDGSKRHLMWQGYFYEDAVSAENPNPYAFIRNSTTGASWADVYQRYWAERVSAEGLTLESEVCLPNFPPMLRSAELAVEHIIFPHLGTLHVGHATPLAAAISTDREVSNPTVQFNVYDSSSTLVFSDTVGTGYLVTGTHQIDASQMWTPSSASSFTIEVIVDADNAFEETDETDNSLTQTDLADSTAPLTLGATSGVQWLDSLTVDLDLSSSQPVQFLLVQVYQYQQGSDPTIQVPSLLDELVFPTPTTPSYSFDLPATTQVGPVELHVWGVSTSGAVNQQAEIVQLNYAPPNRAIGIDQDYFQFSAEAGQDVDINLNVTSGSATMFIWEPGNYWSAYTISGSGVISFDPALTGHYLVKIVGDSADAVYSISSEVDGLPNRTPDSDPPSPVVIIQADRPDFVEPLESVPNTPSTLPSFDIFIPIVIRDN